MGDYLPVKGYETVSVYRCGQAVKLELNRPARMNALDRQLRLDLLDAVRQVADDEEIRAVLVTGAGRAFCSGADLKDERALTPEGHPDIYSVLVQQYHPVITGLRQMSKPVVAAVNGAAAGIGMSIALACDLVLAAESAYFLLAFVNIGLVPDGGSSLLVPSRIGFARAAELAMLGERLGAAKALEWGLINQVWPAASSSRPRSSRKERRRLTSPRGSPRSPRSAVPDSPGGDPDDRACRDGAGGDRCSRHVQHAAAHPADLA